MEFQTRNEDGELRFFDTLKEAIDYAKLSDTTVWKISFTLPTGERVRLVTYENVPGDITWMYAPIEIQEIINSVTEACENKEEK